MNDVSIYIDGFTGEVRERLEALDALIISLAEGITTKISWDMPTYSLPGGGVIVRFCAFKKHIGFFPGAQATKIYAERITALGLPCTKGGIQLLFSKSLPLERYRPVC